MSDESNSQAPASPVAPPIKVNGMPAHAGHTLQVNPRELARLGLMFLERCEMRPAERQAFAMVESMLQAMHAGTVYLAQAPREEEAPFATPGDRLPAG
jgi:hypothetical protein